MTGESVLADKEQQHRIFKMMTPLLTTAKECSLVIVPPIPRYLEAGCCSDPDHVTNIKNADYKAKLEEQVYACKANFKDFAFTGGLRNCRVVASWPAIKKRVPLWHDSVHPVEGGYDDLAKVIIACAPNKPAEKEKRGQEDTGPPAKRQRADNRRADSGCGGGSGYGGQHGFPPEPYFTRGGRGCPRPYCYSGRGQRRGGAAAALADSPTGGVGTSHRALLAASPNLAIC